jgi:hypothetical protein
MGGAGMAGGAGSGGGGGGGGTPSTVGPDGCPDVLAPVLQAFQVEISAADLGAMTDEFISAGNLPPAQFADYQPHYYPIVFHWGGETVTDAFIRLKGQSSWQQAAQLDQRNGKMQFVLVFDQTNANATFHGLGKITLDMPRGDLSFMHDRLAHTWMRSIGVPGLCGTNARLDINGSYYGLYVAEEHVGKHFVKEFFPAMAGNDLFKGGVIATTNSNSANWGRLSTFWNAMDATSLAAIVDVPGSLLEWAAEAMVNDGDGYWGGAHNFYIFDQGPKGYVWLPCDLDATFDWLGNFTGDPIAWWSTRSGVQEVGQHYRVVMGDPALQAQYISALGVQLQRWNIPEIQSRIDDWSKQIRDAVAADPHKPSFSTVQTFDQAIALARHGVSERAEFVTSWLACRQNSSGQPDRDGDGVVWCNDCRDDNAAIHPGAAEVCGNAVDENCNGLYNEGCPPPPPAPPPGS